MPSSRSFLILPALALLGCASGAGSDPDLTPAASRAADGNGVQWSARLNPTGQRTGRMQQADQARVFGNVTLSTAENDPNRTEVRLTITAPNSTANSSLSWAVLPSRCGSGAVPLMSPELFPPIEVGSNGRGQLSASIPLTLPQDGSFHVNVYWSTGKELADVMTCGNLRRSGG